MSNQIDDNGTPVGNVHITVYEHEHGDKTLYSFHIVVNDSTFPADDFKYKTPLLALKKANSRLYGWIQRKLQS